MKIKSTLLTMFLILAFLVLPIKNAWAGTSVNVVNTDSIAEDAMYGFFDLRDRETLIQVTNLATDPAARTYHIQIFDVGNNCEENNFFDDYTPVDTHVYNLRDLQSNDGSPTGIVLPNDAYGVFVVYDGTTDEGDDNDPAFIGNLRILDDNGYEYRTNLVGIQDEEEVSDNDTLFTFNFNMKAGVTLSDIVFVQFEERDEDPPNDENKLELGSVVETWVLYFVDIVDLEENIMSCRNVVTACVTQDHPLYEQLLDEVANSEAEEAVSIAGFEWGINEAIPGSRAEELLCPNNVTTEGSVRLDPHEDGDETDDEYGIFVGLNNGNGRGSMDIAVSASSEIDFDGTD